MGKKSPAHVNKTAEVDAYMEKLNHPLKAEVQTLREIIKQVHPGITEQIKWNAPTFSYKGYLVTFNLYEQDQVRLVFHNGIILNNDSGLLEGNYPDRRLAYFADMQAIKDKQAALKSAIQEWVQLQDQAKNETD